MTNSEATNIAQTAAVAEPGAAVAPEKARSKKDASQKKVAPKSQRGAKVAKPAARPEARKKGRQSKAAGEKPIPREGTAKAKVIAMLQRKGGVTLDEIRKVTTCEPHTVRGFISLLGSKAGLKIESSRREDGARVYAAVK